MLSNWRSRYYCYLLVLPVFLPSCIDTKKTTYFNDLGSTHIAAPEAAVPVIHKNDLLSISVSSTNAEASKLFNESNFTATVTSTTNGSTQQMVGYLITDDGTFKFPELGKIKAEGLTIKQLSDFITQEIMNKELLIEPIVTIRFINFRVTVLGEVAHPTVVSIPNEKMSILEALGLAGDITIYGKRDNVLLIREDKTGKQIIRIDLNSKEILSSPYYYLQSNDVIYVEANKEKVASVSKSRTMLPVYFAALSLATTIVWLSFYKRN
jgi:polysaccharide export outer membrane protein